MGLWKTPLSPAPAFEKVTVPVGGALVGCASISVTVAVHVTFMLICCGIGVQLTLVVVVRRLTGVMTLDELLAELESVESEVTVAVLESEPPEG